MLRFEIVLKLALIPSILYLLLSVVAVALTTHYWILTDWVISRGVAVITDEFDDRTNKFATDATIVYFTDADTDATIVSGCLNLAAAVIAIIAWSTLRKPGMDTVMNSVGTPATWTMITHNLTFLKDCSPFLDTQYRYHVPGWGYHGNSVGCAALYETGRRQIRLYSGAVNDGW